MIKTVVDKNLSKEDRIRDIDEKLFESTEMIERAICLVRDLTMGYNYREGNDGFPGLDKCEISEPLDGKRYVICMHGPTVRWVSYYKPIFTKLEIVEEYLERLQANVTVTEEGFFRLNEDVMSEAKA